MANHVPGRPFARGESGNPNGRPPLGRSVAECVRRLGGDDGRVYVQQLHEIAVGEHRDTKARLAAIGLLLQRGYGQPEGEIDNTDAPAVTRVDLSKLSYEQLKVLEEVLQLGHPTTT